MMIPVAHLKKTSPRIHQISPCFSGNHKNNNTRKIASTATAAEREANTTGIKILSTILGKNDKHESRKN